MSNDPYHRESTDRIAIVAEGAMAGLALVGVGFLIGVAIVVVARALGFGCP